MVGGDDEAGRRRASEDRDRLRAPTRQPRQGVRPRLHLPERSFLYLLHAIRDQKLSPAKAVAAPDWRIFFMLPSDVERELLRLHQFRKVDYQIAGSIVQLALPCATAFEYAERMVATIGYVWGSRLCRTRLASLRDGWFRLDQAPDCTECDGTVGE